MVAQRAVLNWTRRGLAPLNRPLWPLLLALSVAASCTYELPDRDIFASQHVDAASGADADAGDAVAMADGLASDVSSADAGPSPDAAKNDVSGMPDTTLVTPDTLSAPDVDIDAASDVAADTDTGPAPCVPVDCQDAHSCTVDSCAPAGGCDHKPNNSLCDDSNPCTADTCEPSKGCVYNAQSGSCPGGVCEAGKCACVASCAGKSCGDDGCGGSCGACKPGWTCGAKSMCEGAGPNGAVLVPAGSFWMGCNPALDKVCATKPGEKPQHKVVLSAFAIGPTEVTVTAYKACVTAGKCTAAGQGTGCTGSAGATSQAPVNCVTKAQAVAYCGWWATGGRLPTEAEWEKAARGGCELYPSISCATAVPTWPWGEASPTLPCQRAQWYNGCGTLGLANVGSWPNGASPYGLLDMAGNVAEWVSDGYNVGYYGVSPSQDPTGPTGATFDILRGGSFLQDAAAQRTSARHSTDSAINPEERGFRCAVSVP